MKLILFFTISVYLSNAMSINKIEKKPMQVILISVDGLGKNVYELAKKQKKIPHLEKLVSESQFFTDVISQTPSVTLPNHASMISGVAPAEHKVLWNDFSFKEKNIEVPTVFNYLKLNKISNAFIVGKDKFKHLNTESVKYFSVQKNSEAVMADFIKQDALIKPQFIFLHFAEVDSAGHRFGWLTTEQMEAVQNIDKIIGELHTYLNSHTNKKSVHLILTSDHGGHEHTHGSEADSDKQIVWIYWNATSKKAQIKKTKINNAQSASTILNLLNIKLPNEIKWQPAVDLK